MTSTDLHVGSCAVLQSMQSNMMKMREIVHNSSTPSNATKSTNGCQETYWIYSSFRSMIHCVHHRFYVHMVRYLQYFCITMVTLVLCSLVILSQQQSNPLEFIQLFPSAFNAFNPNDNNTSFVESPPIIFALQQKIERMENDIVTVKAQRDIDIDSLHSNLREQCTNSTSALTQEISLLKKQIGNVSSTESTKISDDSRNDLIGKMTAIKDDAVAIKSVFLHESIKTVKSDLHRKVSKLESNLTLEIQVIKKELKSVKLQQQQNTNSIIQQHHQQHPYKDSVLELKREISLLQQQIDSITRRGGNLRKDFIENITTTQADIAEKYSILEAKVQNMEKTHATQQTMEPKKLQQTIDIWDKFMLQQNEMNNEFLRLFQSNDHRSGAAEDIDRADFAVRVVYHTEVMTSSLMENMERKLYYFVTRNYDQNAVRPTVRIGDCTPLKQNRDQYVYIILRLRESIFVNGITIEYIRPSLVQNKIMSAPKNMTLELSKDGYHYYNVFSNYLLYNPLTDGAKKHFQIDRKTKTKYRFAKLNILSNYGAGYSCIYRVQIHGNAD